MKSIEEIEFKRRGKEVETPLNVVSAAILVFSIPYKNKYWRVGMQSLSLNLANIFFYIILIMTLVAFK